MVIEEEKSAYKSQRLESQEDNKSTLNRKPSYLEVLSPIKAKRLFESQSEAAEQVISDRRCSDHTEISNIVSSNSENLNNITDISFESDY